MRNPGGAVLLRREAAVLRESSTEGQLRAQPGANNRRGRHQAGLPLDPLVGAMDEELVLDLRMRGQLRPDGPPATASSEEAPWKDAMKIIPRKVLFRSCQREGVVFLPFADGVGTTRNFYRVSGHCVRNLYSEPAWNCSGRINVVPRAVCPSSTQTLKSGNAKTSPLQSSCFYSALHYQCSIRSLYITECSSDDRRPKPRRQHVHGQKKSVAKTRGQSSFIYPVQPPKGHLTISV